jgi:ABC-type multidrug transport system ATPase subunit
VLIEQFFLERHQHTPVEALSGGTRQKLNLAVALLRDPEVLLLDEPYAGFDREAYRQFISWTEEARRRGRALVLVTHLLLEQRQFDVALQLRDGVLEAADA